MAILLNLNPVRLPPSPESSISSGKGSSSITGDPDGYPYTPYRVLHRALPFIPDPHSVRSRAHNRRSPFASTAKVGRRISMNGSISNGSPEKDGVSGANGGAEMGPSSPHSLKGLAQEEDYDPDTLRQRIADLESAFSSQNTYIHMLETSLRTSSTGSSSSGPSKAPKAGSGSGGDYPGSLSRRSSRIPIPANLGISGVSAFSSSASTNTLRAGLTHSAPIYDLRGTVEGEAVGYGEGTAENSDVPGNLGEMLKLGEGSGSNGLADQRRSLRGSRSDLNLRSHVPFTTNGHAQGLGRMSPVPGSPAMGQEGSAGDGEAKKLDGVDEEGKSGSGSGQRPGVEKRNSSRLGLSLIPRSRVQSAVSHIGQPTISSSARRTSISTTSSSRPSSRASSRASNGTVSPTPGDLPSSSTSGAFGLTSPINLHPNSARTSPFDSISRQGEDPSPFETSNGNGAASGSGSAGIAPRPGGRPTALRKASSAMGASGKVIEGLTREVETTKTHLERVKAELRQSQRLIEQFTRQTADLHETRERMRIEADGLNNVIARKERLLDEVLVRARKAETELAAHTKEKKAFEVSTKKQIDQMSAELEESQTRSKKAEREAVSLKEGFKGMKDSWARELKAVKGEVKTNADRHKQDMEEARSKHADVSKQLASATRTQKSAIEGIQEERRQLSADVSNAFRPQIEAFKQACDAEDKELERMRDELASVAAEVTRIKRIMRTSDVS